MVTALYVILLSIGVFWVGLFLGRSRREVRPSMDFALPPGAHLFRPEGPPRRTERVNLSVPILINGVDSKGQPINESTHTVNLSGFGASIVTKHALKLGQEITLHRVDTPREATVRVIHRLAALPEGDLYGVAFVDPVADLWGACELLTEAKKED